MTREIVNYFIEIRSINLKPGTRKEFHQLYIEVALPLLKRWNFDVVAYGPSLHDENSYYVIRRYDSLAQREEMEDYTDIVFELDEVTVQGLRKL